MLAKEITYTDYDGVQRTETFYFNLNKAELMELNLSIEGGLERKIKDIIAAKDVPAVAAAFKDILLRAYGVKSPDGKHFHKSAELAKEFTETEAYSELFIELLSKPDYAAQFIQQIIPDVPSDGTNTAAEVVNIN